MLMLSRKPGESIVINDNIVITIVEIARGRVQIGVRAPSYVPVYHEEIVRRMVANGEIEPLECIDEPQAVDVV